jgi:Lhr-like helicase
VKNGTQIQTVKQLFSLAIEIEVTAAHIYGTLDDAYELAHELEHSEVNAVFQFLATDFVPSEERTEYVVAAITRHQNKLMRFNQSHGSRQWRQGITCGHQI